MSLAECKSYSPITESKPGQSRVLNSKKIPFSDITDSFKKAFPGSPDNTTFEIYNPSAAFINPPDLYRAARVDSSNGWTKTIIFKYTPEGLKPHLERTFDLEDPFASNIDSEITLGGVQVEKSLDKIGRTVSHWKTILFRGKTIPELRPFFAGPEDMKDIRLIKTAKGAIGVYTRPRSPGNEALGGDGQIGYTEFESLDALEKSSASALEIKNAPLLSFKFPKGEWGGVNHAQVVKDGKYREWILALIHRAYKDKDNSRHYSAGGLLHNPQTGEVIDLGTFVRRSDLPQGPWKGQGKDEELRDVFFPGSLDFIGDRAVITGGMSDAEIGEVEIPNPLKAV